MLWYTYKISFQPSITQKLLSTVWNTSRRRSLVTSRRTRTSTSHGVATQLCRTKQLADSTPVRLDIICCLLLLLFPLTKYVDYGHMKNTYILSWSMSVLAWGMLEYEYAFLSTFQLTEARRVLKWGLDYLLACHKSPTTLIVEVRCIETEFKQTGSRCVVSY